jgi:hypothetical protein
VICAFDFGGIAFVLAGRAERVTDVEIGLAGGDEGETFGFQTFLNIRVDSFADQCAQTEQKQFHTGDSNSELRYD